MENLSNKNNIDWIFIESFAARKVVIMSERSVAEEDFDVLIWVCSLTEKLRRFHPLCKINIAIFQSNQFNVPNLLFLVTYQLLVARL